MLSLITFFSWGKSTQYVKMSNKEKQIAQKSFEHFSDENPILIQEAILSFKEFRKEMRQNKEMRKIFKAARRDPEQSQKAFDLFRDYFNERGIKFGYLKMDKFWAGNVLLVGVTLRGNDTRYGNAQIGLSPGIGLAKGYDIMGCLLSGNGINFGVAARAIVVGGISAGLFFGQNGLCINVGAGYGFNVSGGIDGVWIEDEYTSILE